MSVTNIANENEIRALTLDEIEHVSGGGVIIVVCYPRDKGIASPGGNGLSGS